MDHCGIEFSGQESAALMAKPWLLSVEAQRMTKNS